MIFIIVIVLYVVSFIEKSFITKTTCTTFSGCCSTLLPLLLLFCCINDRRAYRTHKVNDKGNLMTIILQRITKNNIGKFIDNKKGSYHIYIA